MYYVIVTLIAIMLLVPSFAFISPRHTDVMISFVQGEYDPRVIMAAGGRIIKELESMEMIYASVPPSAVSDLAQNPTIEFVESDSRIEIAQATTSEYSETWALTDIGAEPVHQSNYTGKGIKIALLDTGIDYNHPELAPSYKGGYDFINDDSDPMDDNGHGTHVAGILAAARDGKGIIGISPNAEVYAIKVSDKMGSGSFSGLAKGINWAIENDMDIVSMSITGKGGSRTLAKAVQTAYDGGLVMVAAVGNGKGEVLYPAAYEQVIGVGSVRKDNDLSTFSRTGSEVELVAPGSGIKSAAIGGKYRLSSGTSMATPLVTGSIALLGSDEREWAGTGLVDGDGAWTNDELRKVLRGTAKDLGKEGKDDEFGFGLPNLDFPDHKPEVFVASLQQATEEENEPAVQGFIWLAFWPA
jgi:subtilisin family serine protease